MDYTRLSLDEVVTGLEAVARDVQATFGGLDAGQLNWKPAANRWSVAQCLEHLVTANRLMLDAAEMAMEELRPRTMWQRLPILPGVLGRLMIRSQAPEATRKFVAPPGARPASSDIAPDIVPRFVARHASLGVRLAALDDRRIAGVIMASPFAKVITYSVLDGFRLLFAHDRRHVEQARRVMQSPGFPGQTAAT